MKGIPRIHTMESVASEWEGTFSPKSLKKFLSEENNEDRSSGVNLPASINLLCDVMATMDAVIKRLNGKDNRTCLAMMRMQGMIQESIGAMRDVCDLFCMAEKAINGKCDVVNFEAETLEQIAYGLRIVLSEEDSWKQN